MAQAWSSWGGFEVLQNGCPFGWLTVLGGLGIWLVLVFPCWITHRAKRCRTWIAHPPFADQGVKRGLSSGHGSVSLRSTCWCSWSELCRGVLQPAQMRGLMVLI